MGLSFAVPWALVLLLALPLIWYAASRTRTNLARRHLRVVAAVRMLALALLALALAQPSWTGYSDRVSVVYALDVSHSVSAGFVEEALGWIERAQSQAAPASARIVAFADRPVVLETPAQVRDLSVSADGTGGAIDQTATDLERGLDQALSALDRDMIKRVVLLTDGNETSGDVRSVVPGLVEAGVRVFPVVARFRDDRDAWVDGIEVAERLRDGEPFTAVVRVFSPSQSRARVRLMHSARRLGERQVELQPGINRIAFEPTLRGAGAATLVAEVSAIGDTVKNNDRLETSTWIGERPRILYAEGRAEAARFLSDALRSQGLAVDVRAAKDLPADVAALARYDALILSDVPAKQLSRTQMRAVETYVRDVGGGLVFAGGENTFGEDGYSGSALENVLPVEFKAREKRKDLALVIAIDRSYSMKGRKMEYAKEAARAALDLLEEQHRFAVVAFDSQPYISVPMQQVRSKRRAEDQISRIQASGQTNIYPALGVVYRLLQQAESQAKHVILLSDGDTHPADFERLLARMREAKIVVSTVTIGDGGDPALMASIARWGDGRNYVARSAEAIPQIFVEETKKVVRSGMVEEAIRPVVKRQARAFSGIGFDTAPALKGHVSTKARDTAEVLLATGEGAPLLTRWQLGLGKAAMFSSDVTNRWAADWVAWEGYGKFWAQVVRETMRRESGESARLGAVRDGKDALVTLDLLTDQGQFRNGLSPKVQVSRGGKPAETVGLVQSGPGSYEARVPFAGAETLSIALSPAAGVGQQAAARAGVRVLHRGFSDEYRVLPPNLPLLAAIAEQTGGKLAPEIGDVFATAGDRGQQSRMLWPWFALAALLLYLLDIWLRRSPVAWRRLGS
jgi:Ca-activated chloride channel homolog